jgi:hypothetical protein
MGATPPIPALDDGLGGLQRPPPGKHPQLPEQLLLVALQQRMAPFDCIPEGMMPKRHVARLFRGQQHRPL